MAITNTMAMPDYTQDEIFALGHKMDNPEDDVICPRCGGMLMYTKLPSALTVTCETPGCIRDALRGL